MTTFQTHFADAVEHGISRRHRKRYEGLWRWNQGLQDDKRLRDDEVVQLGLFMQRESWDKQLVTASDPTGPVVFAEPPDLDDEGKRLHEEVVAFAAEHNIGDYMTGLAALTDGPGRLPPNTNVPDRRLPGSPVELPPGINDEEAARVAELDRKGRALAARENIDYVDAGNLLELDDEIAAAEAEDGFSDTPWLDTSRRLQPEPWRDEDFERDKRRARTIEWELSHDDWAAGAEDGRDIVYDHAAKLRSDRLALLRDARARGLAEAQEREARRRTQAIDDELQRRARERLSE
jgi:hypothetical protein